MKDIDVYPTRIEIYPYPAPDKSDPIVRACSTGYDMIAHKRYPIGCAYVSAEQKLIVMRGCDLTVLHKLLRTYPKFRRATKAARMKYQYNMKLLPKNKDQVRAIRFLTCSGEYSKLSKYSQQSLNTEPGFGKTYCAISAAIMRGKRTIVILHNTIVKGQWIRTLQDITDIPHDRIIDIDGTERMMKLMTEEVDGDFFLVLHQTISAYFRAKGYQAAKEWFNHMECGTKIIDEVHLFFAKTIQVDFLSSIDKSWYLTGTMTRSNALEIPLFKRYFSNTPSFGEDLKKTKNVIYSFIEYDSYPTDQFQSYIITKRGPNASKFITYAMEHDESRTLIKVILYAMKLVKEHDGRTLILLPKINAGEIVRDILEKKYPEDIVRTLHSRHPSGYNADTAKNATIIISTIGGIGTGSDISGLRNMIIAEPYTSEVTANQLPKRLRPLPNGEFSYCYDLVDTGFEPMCLMQNKRAKYLRKCCQEVNYMQYTEERNREI